MSGHFRKASEALLEAVANAAVELLRLHDFDRSLPRILEMLGTATDVDRMQLMQIERTDTGGARIVRHHEWCAPGIRPAAGLIEIEGRVLELDGFGAWAERFARGEVVAGAVDDFEPPIRRKLINDGTRSLAVAPVFVDGRWWGQIGFDDCHFVRHWTSGEIDALRTLAELVGAAVLHSRYIARLADARRIVENSPTLLFRLGAPPPYALHYISSNIERYGYTAAQLMTSAERWRDIVDPDDLPALMSALETSVGDGVRKTATEFRLVRPDGNRAWFEGHLSPCRDAASDVIAIEGIITDITERKQTAREVERLARTDTLTGLANRGVFMDRLAAVCAASNRGEGRFAVHFIDLDLFKPVNDTLGHTVGDDLLKSVAQRMLRNVRGDDVVARLGGDDFAVLQCGLPAGGRAVELAETMCRAVSEPYMIGGNRIEISASVGLICHDGGRTSPKDVMTRAGRALSRAKADGRRQVRVYDPALEAGRETPAPSALPAAPAA